MLRNVQQCKLRLSPFEQHGVPFPLVVAESDIFPVNVPVARLQFSDQRAFGYLPAPQKPVWTDIVGERGKEQTASSEQKIAMNTRIILAEVCNCLWG